MQSAGAQYREALAGFVADASSSARPTWPYVCRITEDLLVVGATSSSNPLAQIQLTTTDTGAVSIYTAHDEAARRRLLLQMAKPDAVSMLSVKG